jgi:chromosome segregation ATPase
VSALAGRIEAVEAWLHETQRETVEARLAAQAPLNESLEARLAGLEATTAAGTTDIDRLAALAPRVEALETGLAEAQHNRPEAPLTAQAPLNESFEARLIELETLTAAHTADIDRVAALAARVETLERDLLETQHRGIEELRADHELLSQVQQRLSSFEAKAAEAAGADDRVFALASRVDSLEESLTTNQATEARLSEILERISDRVEAIDARLARTEHTATASDQRLRTMAESILDRASDQSGDSRR